MKRPRVHFIFTFHGDSVFSIVHPNTLCGINAKRVSRNKHDTNCKNCLKILDAKDSLKEIPKDRSVSRVLV